MNKNPKISIIIPCYNLGKYLDEAVDSVLAQTFQDFEIIVVNDGSTDEFTNKILNNYSKPKTIVFKTENRGLPATRNFAISKAKGEYILPLDADDKIHKEYLEETVKILDNNKKVGYVTTWIQLFGIESYIWKTKKFSLQEAFLDNYTAITSLFRKECWEKVCGYDEKMIGYQDWDFWISVLENGYEGFVIEKPLFLYRKREGSMLTNSNRNRKYLLEYLIDKHHKTFYDNAKNMFINRDAQIIDVYSSMNKSLIEKDLLIQEKEEIIRKNDLLIQEKEDALYDIYHSRIIKPAIVLRDKLRVYNHHLRSFRNIVELKIIKMAKKYLSKEFRLWISQFLPGKYRIVLKKVKNKKWEGPLISIVTPYYNHGTTINETVESVLSQTFQNFEYIIVNDGSSDEVSNSVFAKIESPKIHKINQENSGVAEARNNGIKIAKGKYILCLDSDDKIDPTYLEKALMILEPNPKVDIVYSDMYFFGLEDGVYKEPEFDPKILYKNNIITTAAVFRRSAWERAGGYKSEIGFEDWEFWINLVEHGAIAKRIPEALFLYRRASMSRYVEDKKRKDLNVSKIQRMHKNYYKKIKKLTNFKYSFDNDSKFENFEDEKYYLKKNNNKNILLLLPWLTFGGAETLIFNYTNRIKNQYNFSIITGIKSENEWEYKFKEITNNIYHLPNLFDNEDEYFDFVKNYINTREIDVVHIIHNSNFYKMLPELKKLFPDLKVVSTVFNNLADHFNNSLDSFEYIDFFTSDNSVVAGKYKEENIDCLVIANGIDCVNKFNLSKYDRLSKRKELGIKEDEKAVYFIGRLSPEKNPDVFLESAKEIVEKHSKIKFFIIGDGPMRETLEKSISEFGHKNITYLGYLTNIPQYLSTADIFVLPSRIEGFPLSNIEAMSMGICVISSDVGGVKDAIIDGKNGFLMEPNSVSALIDKIDFIINNDNVLDNISKNARKTVEEKFSIEILADNYNNLYKNINEK